jgi:hypothetical protein
MASNRWFVLPVVLVLTLACFNPAYADKYAGTIDIFKQSPTVKTFFDNCYGYAVFPVVGKGGFGVGGAYGTGQVYAQAKTSYSKGMAVFVHAKGGLMYEATVGGQKFSYTPKAQ